MHTRITETEGAGKTKPQYIFNTYKWCKTSKYAICLIHFPGATTYR